MRTPSLILITAFTMVASQLFFFTFLGLLFPQAGTLIPKLVCALFLGFALGESSFFSGRILRLGLLLSFLPFLLLAAYFDTLTRMSLQYFWMRMLVLGLILFTQVLVGAFSLRAIYSSDSPGRSYGWLNAACLISLVLVVVFRQEIGMRGFFLSLGGALIYFLFNARADFRPPGQRIQWESFFWGFISFAWLSLYLYTRSLLFFLPGIEMLSYLAFSFFFYFMSPHLLRRIPRSFSPAFLSGFGILLSASGFALLCARTPSEEYLLAPPDWIASLVNSEQRSLLFSLCGSFFLFLPYLFFSLLFPALQERFPLANNLFSLSLGNVLGMGLFSVAVPDLDSGWKLRLLLAILAFMVLLRERSRAGWLVSAFSILVCFVVPSDMDRHLLAQGSAFRFEHRTFFPDQASRRASTSLVEGFSKRSGEAGYILSFGGNRKKIALGSYTSSLSNVNDLLKGHVAASYFPLNGSRALVLGLGNHFTLSSLEATAHPPQTIVVDNFPPFLEEPFRHAASSYIGFSWPNNTTKFIYADALEFLISKNEKFDMIVWNLTAPTYTSAMKMYSVEAIRILESRLSSGGRFVTDYENFPGIDCLFLNRFRFNYLVPRKTSRPAGVLLASQTPIVGLEGQLIDGESICEGVELPTWANPYTYKLGLLHGYIKSLFLDPKDFPDNADGNDRGRSLSFLGSRNGDPVILLASRKLGGATRVQKFLRRKFPEAFVVDSLLNLKEVAIAAQQVKTSLIVLEGGADEMQELEKSGIARKRIVSLREDFDVSSLQRLDQLIESRLLESKRGTAETK